MILRFIIAFEIKILTTNFIYNKINHQTLIISFSFENSSAFLDFLYFNELSRCGQNLEFKIVVAKFGNLKKDNKAERYTKIV